MITVSQAIVEFLKAQGIRHLFGKIGEDVLPILDHLTTEQSIQFISTYREEAAVVMADGYARVTGLPALVLLSGGGPVTRTVAAMEQACCDGSPVILLCGETARDRIYAEQPAEYQNPLGPLFQMARSSFRVTNPDKAVYTLEQTYRSAASGKKGPCYCGIPRDLLSMETSEKIRHYSRFMASGLSTGDPTSIRQACELLVQSQRPVVLLGGGVVWSHASTEAMDLAEFLFAPIVTSNGKSGIVPEDYPLSVGRLGSKANRMALETLAEADVVVCFGCTLNRQTTFGFSQDIFSPDVKMIQVDIDPLQIGRNYPAALGIVGDAKLVLREMLAQLRQMGVEKWPSRVIQRMQKVWERKEGWSREWSPIARSVDRPIRRLRLLNDLSDELGREGIIFGELEWKHCLTTAFFPLIESYDFTFPGAHFPLAMGAKLAFPDRPVAAILGDGQFTTTLTEIATAVEHRISVLAVIARNGCYGSAKAAQIQFHGARYIGVDHPYPNFAEVALSLGAYAQQVENPLDIRPAIRRALESNRPSVIEVIVSSSIADLKPAFQ